MDFDLFLQLVTAHPDVEEGFPFDQDTMVFKVKGKMFALTSLSDWEEGKPSVNLKCDPSRAIVLREQYQAIIPGYHMNKKHWNTVESSGAAPRRLLQEWISHSYDLVLASLPKKVQLELTS